jgi:hypothetical protein
VFVHEGTSEQALALLGADDGDFPILVNRLIFDADVMIPIIRARDEQPSSRRPAIWDFVDSATKKRWHSKILQPTRLKSHSRFGVAINEVVVGPATFRTM